MLRQQHIAASLMAQFYHTHCSIPPPQPSHSPNLTLLSFLFLFGSSPAAFPQRLPFANATFPLSPHNMEVVIKPGDTVRLTQGRNF